MSDPRHQNKKVKDTINLYVREYREDLYSVERPHGHTTDVLFPLPSFHPEGVPGTSEDIAVEPVLRLCRGVLRVQSSTSPKVCRIVVGTLRPTEIFMGRSLVKDWVLSPMER